MARRADVDRLFLQSMLSRGIVPEKLARVVWTKSVQAVNTIANNGQLSVEDSDEQWNNFVTGINRSLDKLELAFRSMRDQKTGQILYSIVNLKGDTAAHMATEYNPAEIAYFKAIVEQIMLAPRHKFSVSSLVAMREVSMIKPKSNMTKSQAEVVLATFVARGWLVRSRDGRYSLSPRFLLELEPYLRSNYEDRVLTCSLCTEIMTTGIACPSPGCKCRMHPYCFKRYSRIRANGSLLCKYCNEVWSRDASSDDFIPIGEKAVKKGELEQRVRASPNSDGEDDDEEREGIDADMESQSRTQPSKPQARKTDQPKGKKKNTLAEDDSDENDEDAPPVTTQRPRRRS